MSVRVDAKFACLLTEKEAKKKLKEEAEAKKKAAREELAKANGQGVHGENAGGAASSFRLPCSQLTFLPDGQKWEKYVDLENRDYYGLNKHVNVSV